jgi:hypothetical protein
VRDFFNVGMRPTYDFCSSLWQEGEWVYRTEMILIFSSLSKPIAIFGVLFSVVNNFFLTGQKQITPFPFCSGPKSLDGLSLMTRDPVERPVDVEPCGLSILRPSVCGMTGFAVEILSLIFTFEEFVFCELVSSCAFPLWVWGTTCLFGEGGFWIGTSICWSPMLIRTVYLWKLTQWMVLHKAFGVVIHFLAD